MFKNCIYKYFVIIHCKYSYVCPLSGIRIYPVLLWICESVLAVLHFGKTECNRTNFHLGGGA